MSHSGDVWFIHASCISHVSFTNVGSFHTNNHCRIMLKHVFDHPIRFIACGWLPFPETLQGGNTPWATVHPHSAGATVLKTAPTSPKLSTFPKIKPQKCPFRPSQMAKKTLSLVPSPQLRQLPRAARFFFLKRASVFPLPLGASARWPLPWGKITILGETEVFKRIRGDMWAANSSYMDKYIYIYIIVLKIAKLKVWGDTKRLYNQRKPLKMNLHCFGHGEKCGLSSGAA